LFASDVPRDVFHTLLVTPFVTDLFKPDLADPFEVSPTPVMDLPVFSRLPGEADELACEIYIMSVLPFQSCHVRRLEAVGPAAAC
jgi:hypothetical protein